MTLIVEDTFTETSDTNVTSHTGETGATWSLISGSVPVIDGGVDELHTANTTGNQYIQASGTPANADWKATITYRNRATAGNGAVTGVLLRYNSLGIDGYVLYYFSTATPYFQVYKFVGSTPSALGSSYTYTLPASEENVDFYVVGSTIRAYNAAGTKMIEVTDSSVTAAGKVGIRFSDYAAPGASGGVNISRIQAWDSATLPSVPSATPQRRRPSGLYIR